MITRPALISYGRRSHLAVSGRSACVCYRPIPAISGPAACDPLQTLALPISTAAFPSSWLRIAGPLALDQSLRLRPRARRILELRFTGYFLKPCRRFQKQPLIAIVRDDARKASEPLRCMSQILWVRVHGEAAR